MDQGKLSRRISQLSRLGRLRDFSMARFRRALNKLARHEEKPEILRQLMIDWTGLPHSALEAQDRWNEVKLVLDALRSALGPPVSLQTALLHHFHSRNGLLKEPRLLSERALAVLRVDAITDPLTGLYNRRRRAGTPRSLSRTIRSRTPSGCTPSIRSRSPGAACASGVPTTDPGLSAAAVALRPAAETIQRPPGGLAPV